MSNTFLKIAQAIGCTNASMDAVWHKKIASGVVARLFCGYVDSVSPLLLRCSMLRTLTFCFVTSLMQRRMGGMNKS
jgi:hypothetical protein